MYSPPNMGLSVAGRRVWIAMVVVLALCGWSRDAAAGELGFRVVSHETPARMYSGQTIEVPVVVQNTGEAAWSDGAGDRLAYHWRSGDGDMLVLDGVRTRFEASVQQGEKLELQARVEVPDEPGNYQLEWRMVRENVHWFPAPESGERSRVDVEVRGEAFVWGIDRVEPPPVIRAAERGTLSVSMRNEGAAPWTQSDRDFVAFHWWDADGRLVDYEGDRGSFGKQVAPGERAEVEMSIRAPKRAGLYRLEVEPVREGFAWYGPPASGQALSPPVVVTPASLRWRLLEHDTPPRMPAGSGTTVTVVIRNEGDEVWDELDRLSYRWVDAEGRQVEEGARTLLPHPLEPGEHLELDARLIAPAEPGDYRLAWEMVREGVRWYGPSTGPLPAPMAVEVGKPALAWSLVERDELPSVWVNTTERIRVVVRNDGAETWSDEAGDHLSYHWLDARGEVVAYDGRRTRLKQPVAPGETVELAMIVRGPRAAGDYRLQIEMVREQVSWFGPSSDETADATLDVTVRWFSGTLQILLALGTGLGLVALRRRRPQKPWARRLLAQLPLVWIWGAVALSAVTFAELSGIGFWKGGLLATLCGACFPVLVLVPFGPRVRVWMGAALVVALDLLALADLVYMHFYGSIVPLTALTAAHHLGEVRASIVALFEPSYTWLLPTPLAAIAVAIAWPADSEAASSRRERRIDRVVAVVVLLGASLPATLRLHEVMSTELGLRVFSERRNAGRLGVFNAHLFDFGRTLREMQGREATPEQTRTVTQWFDERQEEVELHAATVGGAGVARDYNLLLIQVESAQEFVIGARVNGQEITPFMNRLEERGLAYSNLVDQTAQGKTSDGEYAVLSSQHPLRAGALCFLRADNHFVTLAHVLGAAGYSTFSAHPFKRGFWNRAVLHPRYGFSRSMFRREIGPGPEMGWGLADGPFLERMMEEIESLPRPFFAFLITLTLHHPYDEFPERFAELDLGELEGTRLGNYLHGMNYFDRSLEQLFARLEATGLAKNTVVALYGDHDARLELDAAALEVSGVEGWSPSVFHRLERVPFFVVLPDKAATGRVETVAGQIDVGPTLLHYLGIQRPRAFAGRPIAADETTGFAAYPDGSAFAADRFFVARGYDIPREGACFDARGSTRPREDCEELEARARDELSQSRAVLDFDLHRTLAGPELSASIEASEGD